METQTQALSNARHIINKMMLDRNISQSEMARRIGVSRASVSNWLSGARSPKLGNLLHVANILGVNLSDILEKRY